MFISSAIYFLLHYDEWDRFVAPPRHKFVTGATLLQLRAYMKRKRYKKGVSNMSRKTKETKNSRYYGYIRMD